MKHWLDFLWPDTDTRFLTKNRLLVSKINTWETQLASLSDLEIKNHSLELKKRVQNGESLTKVLPEAFALVKIAAGRTLGQKHFDEQLLGGMALNDGKIVEMKTGEGKTLVATLSAYLNALSGNGVHVVTVNDYLSRRDTTWMGQVYDFLGLTVACIVQDNSYIYNSEGSGAGEDSNGHILTIGETLLSEKEGQDSKRDTQGSFMVTDEYLKSIPRKEAYEADITYGTNTEFGFDYLRDNLANSLEEQVQASRGHNYAIVDEVDSILIDEARTPLIIAVPDENAAKIYKQFAKVANRLDLDKDYLVDHKFKTVSLTEEGLDKIETIFGTDIFDESGIGNVHYIEESLKAKELFKKDVDYIVKNGEVLIVDEFTGRIKFGHRYTGGLHQAIEAKEGVEVKEESRTGATITIQNYFRLYTKLSGMTGTAVTSAEEFKNVYKLDLISIPTHKPLIRKDLSDQIFRTEKGKWMAVVKEIKTRHELGQPLLVGTVSPETNEKLAGLLDRDGVPYRMLNAKNHEAEGSVIAQAGQLGSVTLVTNMAGRGVDIILGGNPVNVEERNKILSLGGLHVMGTERHESRRIDNQLRGRSGRQGDPGSSQFFISLEDDLMKYFAPQNISNLMARMNLPEDEAISHSLISKAVESAQAKIEGVNYDMRKHILEYDDVLNKQRQAYYSKRQDLIKLTTKEELTSTVVNILKHQSDIVIDRLFGSAITEEGKDDLLTVLSQWVPQLDESVKIEIKAANNKNTISTLVEDFLQKKLEEEQNRLKEVWQTTVLNLCLKLRDLLWMDHLVKMNDLPDSTTLRSYGQHEPLVEYKRESYRYWQELENNWEIQVINLLFKIG
ncbi:MAG: preprotein translocase subunit SecA [Minisyncoccia bacterium]